MKNPNCDNEHCFDPNGEIRVLPTGGQSNALLCRQCFIREIRFRMERNRELAPSCQFKLPAWDDLKVYDSGQTFENDDYFRSDDSYGDRPGEGGIADYSEGKEPIKPEE